MSEVGKRVQKQSLSFPLLIAWKDDRQIIGTFKEAENAILFATGSCWEGVDFPGDMVSSLIIVTLPFSVPDPLSRYEQSQFSSVSEFISTSVVPDMQRKLKQGFGRAIRTETDTCVVTILDSRARVGGKYHHVVLDALPKCAITEQIDTVAEFIEQVKVPEYFQSKGESHI
jgi:ATP-dependent DNA helicase DinG